MDSSKEIGAKIADYFPGAERLKCVKMPVNGQGTFSFNVSMSAPFVILVRDVIEKENDGR